MIRFETISFFTFLILSAGGSLCYLFYPLTGRRWLTTLGGLLMGAAFLSGTAALVARILLTSRAPFATLYEVLLAFAWAVALLFGVLQFTLRMPLLGTFLTPLVPFLLVFALTRSAEVHPLLPALRSQWLGWHVGMAILSYSAFAAAFALGLLYLFREGVEKKNPSSSLLAGLPDLGSLDALIYRLISLGFPLLTLVIITGAVWAQQAFAKFWQWDPKETWSLITFLIYAGYLHARFVFKSRPKVLALFAVLGFVAVIFCFLGVNLLMSGHHSEITR